MRSFIWILWHFPSLPLGFPTFPLFLQQLTDLTCGSWTVLKSALCGLSSVIVCIVLWSVFESQLPTKLLFLFLPLFTLYFSYPIHLSFSVKLCSDFFLFFLLGIWFFSVVTQWVDDDAVTYLYLSMLTPQSHARNRTQAGLGRLLSNTVSNLWNMLLFQVRYWHWNVAHCYPLISESC